MPEKLFNTYDYENLLNPSNDSTVKMNMYWIVKNGKVFQHKITKVWQCNSNKIIVQCISNEFPGTEVVFMPYAYVPKEKL